MVTKVFQKGTMFWMSLCFSLTWDSVACNGRRQAFVVAWVCIAAPSPQKNGPFTAQLKIAFRRFLFIILSVRLSKEQILFAGDLNIHVDNPRDSDAIKFADLLESFGLQQHVKHLQRGPHPRPYNHQLLWDRSSSSTWSWPVYLRSCLSLLQVYSRETSSSGKAGYSQEISINRHGVV